MTAKELARLVLDMRLAQKEYFDPTARTAASLARSKDLERAVDRAVRDVLTGASQPSLFGEGGRS